MSAYTYATNGRNRATLLAVAGIWTVALVLLLWIDLALWIAGVMAVATLPALYDLKTARQAGLRVSADLITWYAGPHEGRCHLEDIHHVRFDTRLDLSVKVTLVTRNMVRQKVPFEATPPHVDFEKILQDRGITTQRHHFGFI